MSRLCVGAVRCNDIILYRSDLIPAAVNDFIVSEKNYVECPQSIRGNIFYDDGVILQEWDKYKVKSLSGNFKPEDFIKIGEFGSEDFGTLLFKNCVGIAKFKNLAITIESSKISKTQMERLVSIVNSYIVNLSYDFNRSTFLAVKRDKKQKTDLEYQVFLMIHNALSTEDNGVNVFKNFNFIENNPCRTMISLIKYENISTVSEVTDDALQEIFSGGSRLREYKGNQVKLANKLSSGKKKYIPEDVLYEEIVNTFDNAENRFIKFFLSWCLGVITKFQKEFSKKEDFRNIELLNENENHIKKLNFLITQTFLKTVGKLQTIPMYSTVLTRRDGYRQLFHLYLGIRSMPIVENDSDDIKELIENKSLDVLYENYCYFGLSDVVASIYGQRLDKKKYKITKTQYSKTLEKRTNSNYFEFERTDELPKVRIHYNKNYIVESYSKAFDPDISIEIYDTSDKLDSIYVFDSKFRVNIHEISGEDDEVEEIRKYKYDDISKMHTYRDALKAARGAFILYPGSEDELFFEDESIDKGLLYGVGAFKLGPGKSSDFTRIKDYVERLLKIYKNKGC